MCIRDSFRGFDTYWAIPAGESTARNGRWENGPGMDLFRRMSEMNRAWRMRRCV